MSRAFNGSAPGAVNSLGAKSRDCNEAMVRDRIAEDDPHCIRDIVTRFSLLLSDADQLGERLHRAMNEVTGPLPEKNAGQEQPPLPQGIIYLFRFGMEALYQRLRVIDQGVSRLERVVG